MREALAGLTVRGRAFFAAGVTSVVCAVLLGQSTLSKAGVLLVALPLLTAYVVGRARYRLGLVRVLAPQVVTAGQPARVRLSVTNEGRMPSGALRLEEQLPYSLGARPRFVLERIEHGWQREVSYQIRSDVRGRFEIGPMTARMSDPFGLVEMHRTFHTTTPLLVTPRTVDLPPLQLGGAIAGSGDNRPRSFATGSAEDVTVREYRRGDDLRRVHWRSSARVGELMVRREEQDWQSRATVLLDNRAGAHAGRGSASSLESAVVMAASVAVHLARRGFTVRLVTAAGEEAGGSWHVREAEASAAALLEALAVVETVPTVTLETGWLGEQSYGGLTVAVVGRLTASDAPAMRRIHHHAGLALAVSLDAEAWAADRARAAATAPRPDGPADTPAAALLARQGWRVATMRPDSRPDQVWRELGARSARAVRPVGGVRTSDLLGGA